ncbi:type IV pilus assembly protein FimV [Andreprevotia chitinilytica]|uniref:type IV pilus assembly protein FimV n=1 Tax=Andreprevotia chitinilytica TaxID=396808 RepID=UPI00055930FF|nr:hypothetical protein [Andreprevotia chitinilytica]
MIAAGLCYGTPLYAAMLGDMQVRSALGERFQAAVSVAAADDESLSNACFRLVPPPADDDAAILRRARLVYQPDDERGGKLIVYGDEKIDEPLLHLGIRVKCPDEERRDFQRDYSVLLDPREYVVPAKGDVRNARGGAAAAVPLRNLPALGGVWRTRDGDNVDLISRAYFPRDKATRSRFVDAFYLLNPDLPQGLRARLEPDLQLALPDRSSVQPAAAEGALAPQPRQPQPDRLQALPALPPLRIEGEQPSDRQLARQPLPMEKSAPAGEDTFRLHLSGPSLDLERKSNLTPEESLRVREHLLSLSSDDQTAQLLQLKYQISELEKQLTALKTRSPDDASNATQPAMQTKRRQAGASDGWSWAWLLLPLLLIAGVAAWVYRRWRLRREYEDAESFSFATNFEARPGLTSSVMASSGFGSGPTAGMRELAQNIAQAASDFHNDDVDVVLPNNVSEEAQLLIDHGLVQQAINLLDHELGQHPTALVLWMKLFEIYRQQAMKQPLQERAVAFRLQFASDTLWQQVQSIGRQIDPDNPLYRSLDEQVDNLLEIPSGRPDKAGSEQDESDQSALAFASMMHEQAGLMPPDSVSQTSVRSVPSPRSDWNLEEQGPPTLPQDALAFDLAEDEQEESKSARPDVGQGMVVAEVSDIDPKQFVTDDPELQKVPNYLAAGNIDGAFHVLEETLYHGTMDQRMVAMKWLDKLAPIRNS